MSREMIAFDLLAFANKLAEITDQPIDKSGMIRVRYQFASEIIHKVQIIAGAAAIELTADDE